MSAVARRAAAQRTSVRIGLSTLVGALAVVAFALTAQNGMPGFIPGFGRTHVAAHFTDVGALRAGDEVRIADVRSGFVDDIEMVGGAPVVHLALDGGREVYADASATIDARSALGQKYVDLDPGSAGAGTLEGPISLEKTDQPVELDDVLNTFDPETRRKTQTTLRQVGRGLAGRGAELNAGLEDVDGLLADVATISDALASDQGADLTRMLHAADLLSTSLDGQGRQLALLVSDLAETMEAVGVDHRNALGQTLAQAPATLRDVRGALRTLDEPLANTAEAVTELRPGADALAAALPDTRGLLRDGVEPLALVPGVSADADEAVTALTPVVADARPVVRRLGTTFVRLEQPLTYMMPYGPEFESFWRNFAGTVSNRDGDIGMLRIHAIVNPEVITGMVPVRSPLTKRDPYPAPGAAERHRTRQVMP